MTGVYWGPRLAWGYGEGAVSGSLLCTVTLGCAGRCWTSWLVVSGEGKSALVGNKSLTLSERSCDLEHGNRLFSAFASWVARLVLACGVLAVFVIKLVTLSMSITLAASLCLDAHVLRADQATGCQKAESRHSIPSMSVVLVAASFVPDKRFPSVWERTSISRTAVDVSDAAVNTAGRQKTTSPKMNSAAKT
eukprot:7385745-Prymnesium_polylepis.2